jgi:hypothetical protein
MAAASDTTKSPIDRYRRELRELLVAVLDFDRVRAYPPGDAGLRSDCMLAAEHLSETYLRELAPAGPEARAVWAEVAEDVLGCVERNERGRLRPTAGAVRVAYRWWYDMGWFRRAWHCVRGERVPRPGGRPLREIDGR